jgi:hypothetical protein
LVLPRLIRQTGGGTVFTFDGMKKFAILRASTALAGSGVAVSSTPAWAIDYDCSDFSTQGEAQQYLLPGDPYGLDADGDGTACDSLPAGGGGGSYTWSGDDGGTVTKPKASVKISITKKPVAAHKWRITCTVKRSGKAYAGKAVTFEWRDNGGPWYRWPKPRKTDRRGQARLTTAWPPPAGKARCRTAGTSTTKAGQSRAMDVWPR